MSEETTVPKRSKPFTCRICQQTKTTLFHEARTGKSVGRFCVECGYVLTKASSILRFTSVRVVADLLARGRTELVIAGQAYEIVPTDHFAIEMTRHEKRRYTPPAMPESIKPKAPEERYVIDEYPCWGEWSKDDE